MPQDFESALTELETIVSQLDEGNLPLQQALELVERGIRLSRHCQQQLDNAERKVEMLIKGEDGSMKAIPFDGE